MVTKDKLDWCYYFKSINSWIRCCSKDMNEGFSVFTRQTRVKEHYKEIADSGVEFYTCDDDDLDKEYGMYYGNLDFDPLMVMESHSGHTKMFHKEDGKWKQL
jgi:hypothetical protein|tara:strand:+ start:803 stop:1108 length:306 start_codon:yes stop_codon:yes gene_type:complete